MENNIDFIKLLIEAKRYKDYKKDYWGKCDLIIVSEIEYQRRKHSLDEWQNKNTNRHLIISKKASVIIWLIETLKPYIKCDYLSIYDYYLEIAAIVGKNKKSNDKELLLEILDELVKDKWLKEDTQGYTVIDSDLNTWLKFGMEHNDPFFVKFMTLWFAFNQEYNKFSSAEEWAKIKDFCENNKEKLLSVHKSVINSPFIICFKEKPIKDMKTGKVSIHQREYFKNLNDVTPEDQIVAIFQMMYQVRCNLFHGSKTPDMERDLDLVRNSGEILEIYLKAVME